MLSKMRKMDNQGFTLIELMIVIAIIGILAAIAIPNFIAYRNKSFCSGAESDAKSIAGAIADYFAVPTNVSIQTSSLVAAGVGQQLSNKNTWTISPSSDLSSIWITVTDASTRCPTDYQTAMSSTNSPRGYWLSGVYYKSMEL